MSASSTPPQSAETENTLPEHVAQLFLVFGPNIHSFEDYQKSLRRGDALRPGRHSEKRELLGSELTVSVVRDGGRWSFQVNRKGKEGFLQVFEDGNLVVWPAEGEPSLVKPDNQQHGVIMKNLKENLKKHHELRQQEREVAMTVKTAATRQSVKDTIGDIFG